MSNQASQRSSVPAIDAKTGRLAGAARRQLQVSSFGVGDRLGDELRQTAGGPIGSLGAQQHAVLDPVGEERASGRIEQVLLVQAKLEEGERVGAVPGNELPRRTPGLGVGKTPRCRERPEHQVGDREQSTEGEQGNGQR